MMSGAERQTETGVRQGCDIKPEGRGGRSGGVEEGEVEDRFCPGCRSTRPCMGEDEQWEQTCSLLSAWTSILSPKIRFLITSIFLPLRVFRPLLFAPLDFNVDFLLFYLELFWFSPSPLISLLPPLSQSWMYIQCSRGPALFVILDLPVCENHNIYKF